MQQTSNEYRDVVDGFGDEWSRFDQSQLDQAEAAELFAAYFAVFPWDRLPPNAVGMDVGCGSGRWARLAAQKVGKLHCIDASSAALSVARRNLAGTSNCEFHHASVAEIPLPDGSLDFGYSLGVLHHVPDTGAAIAACAAKLKKGAPFLVYLYYAFDNRPWWFRWIWRMSEVPRHVISRLPHALRYLASQAIAALVYWPLSRFAGALEKRGRNVDAFPLSAYRNRSFYVLRTDALDRFGTRVEHRFTRVQIERMMRAAGFTDIVFHDGAPYWCAAGTKQ